MAKKHLWATPDPVDESENNVGPRSMARPGTLAAAASLGRREQLVALRDRLADEIDNPETLARDLASMSIRYMAVIKDIDDIDSVLAAREGDELGEAAESPDETFDASAV